MERNQRNGPSQASWDAGAASQKGAVQRLEVVGGRATLGGMGDLGPPEAATLWVGNI